MRIPNLIWLLAPAILASATTITTPACVPIPGGHQIDPIIRIPLPSSCDDIGALIEPEPDSTWLVGLEEVNLASDDRDYGDMVVQVAFTDTQAIFTYIGAFATYNDSLYADGALLFTAARSQHGDTAAIPIPRDISFLVSQWGTETWYAIGSQNVAAAYLDGPDDDVATVVPEPSSLWLIPWFLFAFWWANEPGKIRGILRRSYRHRSRPIRRPL